MCNVTGTLRRFARSDWFACAACRRTLLFADGGFARAGTVGEPWRRLAAAAVLCAAIGSSAYAAPLMARVLPIGHGEVRLGPAAR